MLLSVKEHEMHHRGQLMLIERILGITPHLTRRMQERFARKRREKITLPGRTGFSLSQLTFLGNPDATSWWSCPTPDVKNGLADETRRAHPVPSRSNWRFFSLFPRRSLKLIPPVSRLIKRGDTHEQFCSVCSSSQCPDAAGSTTTQSTGANGNPNRSSARQSDDQPASAAGSSQQRETGRQRRRRPRRR